MNIKYTYNMKEISHPTSTQVFNTSHQQNYGVANMIMTLPIYYNLQRVRNYKIGVHSCNSQACQIAIYSMLKKVIISALPISFMGCLVFNGEWVIFMTHPVCLTLHKMKLKTNKTFININ